VHDVAQFCDNVLPRFFQHANWSSFTRQLANYNFVHVRNVDDAWVFEHPQFNRSRPEALYLVVRRAKAAAIAAAAAAAAAAASGTVATAGAAASSCCSSKASGAVTRKRACADISAADGNSDDEHSLLKSLQNKLDVQIANQERILQGQARIVELLEAQERRSVLNQLDADRRYLESHARMSPLQSLFDLDTDDDINVKCPIHSNQL
jgi:hypothetical protein